MAGKPKCWVAIVPEDDSYAQYLVGWYATAAEAAPHAPSGTEALTTVKGVAYIREGYYAGETPPPVDDVPPGG